MENDVKTVWMAFKSEDTNVIVFEKTMSLTQAIKNSNDMRKEGYRLLDCFTNEQMREMGMIK